MAGVDVERVSLLLWREEVRTRQRADWRGWVDELGTAGP